MYDFEIVWFVESLGYLGIFIMTFVESTYQYQQRLPYLPDTLYTREKCGLLVLVVSSIEL
jgi:membrane protein YqaA with SNARE-associated domain